MTRQALAVPLLAAVVAGGAGAWVTAEVPESRRVLVAVFSALVAVALGVALAVAAHRSRTIGRLQSRIASLEAAAAQHAAEAARLADETIPSAVKGLREGGSVDTVLMQVTKPGDQAHGRLLRRVVQEIGTGERMRASAMAACANAAGRVQALATSMLADLREMENRHDESVLGDLLKLDHTTAQTGRIADSIAVLTGARSGRRWTKPIVMESILRGAVGRISAYQRVRVHAASNAAVAGYAAEGVMHALAELMDNATSFSPPTEEVHVYVEETHTGVVVTIEDGGLVMGPSALARAQKAVSSQTLDLTTLSGTRLGLAVVGCLARKHGLTVSFRPSARGGTGVVVLIPQQLITHINQGAVPGAPARNRAESARPRTAAAPAARATGSQAAASAEPVAEAAVPVAPPTPSPATEPSGPSGTSVDSDFDADASAEPRVNGLPRRRRGETLAAATRATPRPAPDAKPKAPRTDAGARFGAFRDATRGGSTGDAPGRNTTSEASAETNGPVPSAEPAQSAESAENDQP
ncbi:ATP-binding protein [Streptomyces sp. NBRC 110028]|uniref:ATP-binding protein n=1 Tax=Streptomyces sp. NBRC 110028 TaxID=1621260 RepID=UPI0006E456BA|nr:ATP-binding protein [Streptomyces sp. NBRC 110028]